MNSSTIFNDNGNNQRIRLDANTALINLRKTFNDQYTCTECDIVPEISKINFHEGKLEFVCPDHGKRVMGVKEYIQSEYKNLYYNIKCEYHKTKKQFSCLKDIFNYCRKCSKYFCEKCSKEHIDNDSFFIKVNEINNKCHKHLENYVSYCKECNKHFCFKDKKCCHELENIEKPNNSDIESIQNKIKELKNNIDIESHIVILLDGLLKTYQSHPSNYFHSINITNIAKSLGQSNNNETQNFKRSYKKYKSIIDGKKSSMILLNKFNKLEKKVFNLIGDEEFINLSGKNIENKIFEQICIIEFNNLKKLNLSHNNISNIDSLKILNSPHLKELDLSHNKILELKPFDELSLKSKELENVDLSFNLIEIVDTFKKKIFPKLKSLNLDFNKIIKKDFDEIRRMIEGNKEYKNNKCTMLYSLINEGEKTIRIFGAEFVRINKDNCYIIINDEEKKDLCQYYEYDNNYEENISIELIMSEEVTNINQLFYGCTSLISLSDISYWNTSKITEMEYIFCECTSLTSLPDISKWDTSNVYKMNGMFNGCKSLTSLPNISKWDISKAFDISYMFANCSSLLELPDISNWKINKVSNISGIFSGCSSLSELPDISIWDTSSVMDMSEMFKNCSSISFLPDISKWNTYSVVDMRHMFSNCTSLLKLPDISEWDLNELLNKNDMFCGCNNIKNDDIPEQFK